MSGTLCPTHSPFVMIDPNDLERILSALQNMLWRYTRTDIRGHRT